MGLAQCTGQPGPCKACSKKRKYCHFDIKLDARRKIAYEPSTSQRQQQFVLHSLLLSIKFNDYKMVKRLVEAIRNDNSPPNVAKVLQHNIEALQEEGLLTKQDIGETDMISLVLNCLFGQGPGSSTNSNTSTAPYDILRQASISPPCSSVSSSATNESSSLQDMLPFQIQSGNSNAGQYSTEFSPSFPDLGSMFTSNTFPASQTPCSEHFSPHLESS